MLGAGLKRRLCNLPVNSDVIRTDKNLAISEFIQMRFDIRSVVIEPLRSPNFDPI